MNQVTCNKCEQDFKIPKLRRSVLQDLVYEHYFHCPECNHKYISCYTNKKIRHDINRQKKRWKKYNVMSSPDAERKLLARIKTGFQRGFSFGLVVIGL